MPSASTTTATASASPVTGRGRSMERRGPPAAHIAPFYDEAGRIVAQKVRLPGKDFKVLGDLKAALPLFGQQLCRDGGKQIVVTEGEIDALSVAQAMGLNWPAVSVPNGAAGAHKSISRALGFLERSPDAPPGERCRNAAARAAGVYGRRSSRSC